MEMETKKEVKELGQLSLLDQIALLNRPEWTSPHCPKCSRSNPGHTELECPEYEYCGWCRTSGSYGFIARHKCTVGYEDKHMSNRCNKADAELWQGNCWD